MSTQMIYTEQEKQLAVYRRLVVHETFDQFVTWTQTQLGNLPNLTSEATVKSWIEDYQRSHKRDRYKLFWKDVDNKFADDIQLWTEQEGESCQMNGYSGHNISLTPNQQLTFERRRQMIRVFLHRHMRNTSKSLSSPFNLSLVVEGLNLLWPINEVPGKLPFTEDEIIKVMDFSPDMPALEVVPASIKKYSALIENVKWKPKESFQGRVCEERAKRCEELALMANVTIPRHLILYNLPFISTAHPHYAWCGKPGKYPVNPFFQFPSSIPVSPSTEQVEKLIEDYLEQGWGFESDQISYSLRAGNVNNVGIRHVVYYLVGQKYPWMMYTFEFVQKMLDRSKWRYAALSTKKIDVMKLQAEKILASKFAERESRDEEEEHQYRLSIARDCLKTWCKLEAVDEKTFFDYRLFMLMMSDRDSSFQNIQHPHLYPFLYSFAIRVGDISADEMYTPVPYTTREWIWRWIHFIIDPTLDSSLVSNSARGCEFRVGLVNYCNARGHDPLQDIINVTRWEIELVLDYWMCEGSFYAADWVILAICNRKRTTIQRLVLGQSHRYPVEMRRVRDWTLPFGSEE
ncbi:hypothetical protein I203_106095 [Kwoniella mangroviensis CBS 8507]|uniref:uncharacterized protein n=1 Tax=Kwoniella mangroviensis CBS 8507 TaxID=1296122 RepID=UPI00305A8AC3